MSDGFDDWRFAIVDGKVPAQDDLKAFKDGAVRTAVLRKLTDSVNGKPNMKPLTNSTSKLKLIAISAPSNSYLALVYPEGTRLNVFGVIRQPEKSILDTAYVKRVEAKVERWIDEGQPVAAEVRRRQAKSTNKPPTKTSRSTKSPEKSSWLTPEMMKAAAGINLELLSIRKLAIEETGLRLYVKARRSDYPYPQAAKTALEQRARARADVDRARNLDDSVRYEAKADAIHRAIEARCLEASPLKDSDAPSIEQIQAGWVLLTGREKAAEKDQGLDFMI